MVEKMKEVSIPWGQHTLVKKLEFSHGELFIGKFVKKDDGFVSWHMHETESKFSLPGAGMVAYAKEFDTIENEEKALNKMIQNFEEKVDLELISLL